MPKSDDRVLTFFVSGALLAGVACSKEAEPDHPNTTNRSVDTNENVNEGPKGPVPLAISIDAGPPIAEAPLDEDVEPDRVNTNQIEDPVELPVAPKRVNTNHINNPPTVINVPDKAPNFKTNTGRIRKPPAKKDFRTNTGWIGKTPEKAKTPDSK